MALEELRDISGLDPVGVFPLAPIWWLVIFFTTVATIGGIIWLSNYLKYRRSWQYSAYKKLGNLLSKINRDGLDHSLLQDLSEEIRKIAILKFDRESCASLTGKKWLSWLEQYDPKGFNWSDYSEVLIDLRYADLHASSNADIEVIQSKTREIIEASQKWVATC